MSIPLPASATHLATSTESVVEPEPTGDAGSQQEGCPTSEAPDSSPPISLAEVLDDLVAFLEGYVVLPSAHEPVAIALWIAHTWCADVAETTPYLLFSSPEPRCGKTRTLELLALLTQGPHHVANTTVAALFRLLDRGKITLLLDEADSIFSTMARGERAEALRGILNAGHRRGAVVQRMGGSRSTKLESFSVYGPKAIAMIGDPPPTIADRSITVRLQRKAHGERVRRLRIRDVASEAEGLAFLVREATAVIRNQLAEARPAIPIELDDRAADGWEPLVAIADAAGGPWPDRARLAAVALSSGREPDDETIGVRLLGDIWTVWPEHEPHLFTRELLKRLRALEESPWEEWSFSAHQLARRLRPFELRSGTVRIAHDTAKGWTRRDFERAWGRYVTTPGDPRRHNVTTVAAQRIAADTTPLPASAPEGASSLQDRTRDGVTDESADQSSQGDTRVLDEALANVLDRFEHAEVVAASVHTNARRGD